MGGSPPSRDLFPCGEAEVAHISSLVYPFIFSDSAWLGRAHWSDTSSHQDLGGGHGHSWPENGRLCLLGHSGAWRALTPLDPSQNCCLEATLASLSPFTAQRSCEGTGAARAAVPSGGGPAGTPVLRDSGKASLGHSATVSNSRGPRRDARPSSPPSPSLRVVLQGQPGLGGGLQPCLLALHFPPQVGPQNRMQAKRCGRTRPPPLDHRASLMWTAPGARAGPAWPHPELAVCFVCLVLACPGQTAAITVDCQLGGVHTRP